MGVVSGYMLSVVYGASLWSYVRNNLLNKITCALSLMSVIFSYISYLYKVYLLYVQNFLKS